MNSLTPELPITEQDNPNTTDLSSQPTEQILRLMNAEDALVAPAVELVIPQIGKAVAGIVERLKKGGRLFYIGTGTSGRLGVLDAAECPPTFGVSPELVQAIIAGGYDATYRAVEASEDDENAGVNDLNARGFSSSDVLVGIAASGSTPYTVGAVSFARSHGALTIALTCVPNSPITVNAEISIVPVVGPEVISGSTRLKAGTAQKLVLNMVSTATMTRLGYVRGNRMTNVQARNSKLRSRALRILAAETGVSIEAASTALDEADGDIRVALVMVRGKVNKDEARASLEKSQWIVEAAVEAINIASNSH